MSALFDIVSSLVEFIVSSFQSVIWLITVIPDMIASLTAAYSYAPNFLLPFLGISVSLTAIFAVIRLI